MNVKGMDAGSSCISCVGVCVGNHSASNTCKHTHIECPAHNWCLLLHDNGFPYTHSCGVRIMMTVLERECSSVIDCFSSSFEAWCSISSTVGQLQIEEWLGIEKTEVCSQLLFYSCDKMPDKQQKRDYVDFASWFQDSSLEPGANGTFKS